MTTATFTPDVVACRLAATSKKQLLQQLSTMAAAHAGLCDRKVLSAIISREISAAPGSATVWHFRMRPSNRPRVR